MIIVYTHNKKEIKRMLEDFPWWETFKKSKFCVVAEHKGRVVGACCVKAPLNIFPTYVLEEYRNLGIARTLIRNVMIIAKRKNYSFLLGTVGWESDPNIPIRKVVQKLGVRKVADMGNRTVIMWPIGTTGNLAFASTYVLFALIPREFQKKVVKFLANFV